MADGSTFDLATQQPRPGNLPGMIIDSFAGGGGASTGIERALGRSPDVAINHDAQALSMHAVNHPATRHLNTNIWQVDPSEVCRGRRVALAWFSPDCKHHSKAKGGKPVKKSIRDLAWVVVLWAKRARPEVIFLENVEEFRDWGPLTADDKPCPDRKGQTFKAWVQELRRLGYKVDWRELKACDYGAPTIRKRLFLIARRDGLPIVWPAPTHAKAGKGGLAPWVSAASIIDWSLPCPSIFDTSADIMAKHGLRAIRPLQDATLQRIARGVMRYVVQAAEPFIVNVANSKTTGRAPNVWPLDEPLRTLTSSPGFGVITPFVTYGQHGGANRSVEDPLHTVTASQKDQNAIAVPTLVSYYGDGDGGLNRAAPVDQPVSTVTTANRQALVSAFLAQHNTGVIGRSANEPLSTLTTRGTQQQVVAAHLINMHGAARSARSLDDPHPSLCAGSQHGALVAAFLQKYYGQGTGQEMAGPLHTVATRDTFGLVTVEIDGQTYAITDIGMRMLTPREQFRAQGFPDTYIIDRGHDGTAMPKTAQTRMCGNSVSPMCADALVRANCAYLAVQGEVVIS
jgi:DNA (cytosine-5)-methyltransferase 1